jgi:serine/threonine-protein kinase
MNLLKAIEVHLPSGYAIQGQLGTGATSWVYLASKEDTGQQIVIKVMRPGNVKTETVDRFLREMQILTQLEHPRIVPILERGEANGMLFFTMPYIEGQTLRARMQEHGALDVHDALRVARDVTEALGHAHSKGVVHRDVKPENILLAPNGDAFLMDFGFASAPSLTSHDGDPNHVVGTPEYMSPEQVSGKRASDWRSDFFSLGLVLYEMLTCQLPFRGDSARTTMMRRLNEPAPDVRAVRPEVPDDVAAIVRRNLSASPNDRYEIAGALRAALEASMQRVAAA